MVNNTIQTLEHGTHYPNRLFVGSLPGSASASDLAEFFKEFGTVLEGKVVLDTNGNSRRFGFITFACNEDVSRVLNQGAIFFRGKQISVGPAVKRVPESHSSMVSAPQKVSIANPVPCSPLPPLSKAERMSEATTPPMSPVSPVHWQNVFINTCHPSQKSIMPSVHLSPTPPLYIISCDRIRGTARPAHFLRMPCGNTPLLFNSQLIARNGQVCLNSVNHHMTLQ